MAYQVRYNFRDLDSTSKFSLTYDVFEGDFRERWLQVLQYELNRNQKIRQDHFYGQRFTNEKNIREEMQRNIDIVNSFAPKGEPWIKGSTYPDMTHEDLMKLHEEFEFLSPRPEFTSRSAPHEMVEALIYVNVLIHRYEGIYAEPGKFHVDALFMDPTNWAFEESDYQLFTLEQKQGWLYLDYGVTGVPPAVAFWQKVEQRPVPQYNYKAGAKLFFWGDSSGDSQKDQMATWLKEKWDMDIFDPKLALGYIPLGKIHGDFDSREIADQLERHNQIESIEILDAHSGFPKQVTVDFDRIQKYYYDGTEGIAGQERIQKLKGKPLSWPDDPEIYHHLNYRPWIILPETFNAKPIYEESLAVLDQFVDHRNYDTDSSHPGRWRSLALKAQNGDPTNTYAHSHYRQAANYQLTDIAQHCPYTMDMLSLYTDVSKCQRIRFMLLEPGAKIHVHTDSQGDDVTLAVNIALNMPEGCEFWIDTNPDGSHNEYTQKIPVTGGQAFLLNNAKFHYVVNNSDTPRIHVIFHGPLRCSDKELLDAAREQNGTGYEKGVINSLVVKKSFLGEKISHDSKLYSQWITAGIHTPLLPKFMKTVLLFDDQKNPEVMHEAKHYITQASIFPLEHELCEYRHLDTKLEEFHQSGVRYLIAIGAGTYCESFADFIHNTLLAIHEMKANNSPAMAHIIDHKDRKEGLPYFHEQFFILDLQKWDELGRPKIQKPYHHNEANFPAYKKGPSFHDGYTPKFLHPQIPQRAWFFTRSHQEETGMGGLGTELMASALRHGQSLLNVPMYLRDKKMYSYPFAGSCWQRDEVKKRIENRIGWDKDHVFVFNNEDPFSEAFEHLPNFCPQNLYSVAAGMKPYMLNQKIQDRCGTPANLHFFDFSQPALEFHKNMVFANKTDCISYLADQFKNQLGNLHKDAIPLAKEKLDSLLNTHYQGEFGPLKNQMAMGGKSFTELNLLKEPEKLIAQIDFSKPFMIWHSNIWKSNNSLYYLNQNELRKNYDDFIQALSEKLKMKAWINPSENLHDAVIGESLQQPFALITCGNGWCRPSLKWRQI